MSSRRLLCSLLSTKLFNDYNYSEAPMSLITDVVRDSNLVNGDDGTQVKELEGENENSPKQGLKIKNKQFEIAGALVYW